MFVSDVSVYFPTWYFLSGKYNVCCEPTLYIFDPVSLSGKCETSSCIHLWDLISSCSSSLYLVVTGHIWDIWSHTEGVRPYFVSVKPSLHEDDPLEYAVSEKGMLSHWKVLGFGSQTLPTWLGNLRNWMTVFRNNGIKDACSTVDIVNACFICFYLFSSVVICCYLFYLLLSVLSVLSALSASVICILSSELKRIQKMGRER